MVIVWLYWVKNHIDKMNFTYFFLLALMWLLEFLITYVTHILFLLDSAALEYNVQCTDGGHTDKRHHLMVKKIEPHFGDSGWNSRYQAMFPGIYVPCKKQATRRSYYILCCFPRMSPASKLRGFIKVI